jgi:hypothetical protein
LTANNILATEGNIGKLIHGGERTGGHFSIRAHYAMAEGEGAVKFVLCTPQSALYAVYLFLVVTPAGPFFRLAQYLGIKQGEGTLYQANSTNLSIPPIYSIPNIPYCRTIRSEIARAFPSPLSSRWCRPTETVNRTGGLGMRGGHYPLLPIASNIFCFRNFAFRADYIGMHGQQIPTCGKILLRLPSSPLSTYIT